MLFPFLPNSLKATDARLHGFLRAQTELEADRHIETILTKHIRPTCETILHARFAATADAHSHADWREDLEDVRSAAINAMVARLYKMRLEYQTTQAIEKPIRDVCKYAAMTTFNAWREYLREIKPVYHRVYRYIRSLLSSHNGKDNRPPLAAWEETQSNGRKVWVGGLARWQDQKRRSACGDRLQALLRNPKAGMAEAWAHARKSAPLEVGDPLSLDGLHALFAWLDYPVALNHLTKVLCEATDRTDAPTLTIEPGMVFPDPTSQESGFAFMQMVWEYIMRARMTAKERGSLLLGGEDPNGFSLIHCFFEAGVATHWELANAMELPVTTLMDIWPRLPLRDKAIAEILECTEPDVASYRFHGRSKLGKCLAEALSKDF